MGLFLLFTWKSKVGRSGDLAGEIYRAVTPTKGIFPRYVLWGFPLSPGWVMLLIRVSSETGLLLSLK